jgi:hypothetical protein
MTIAKKKRGWMQLYAMALALLVLLILGVSRSSAQYCWARGSCPNCESEIWYDYCDFNCSPSCWPFYCEKIVWYCPGGVLCYTYQCLASI